MSKQSGASASSRRQSLAVALAGNPNAGKTAFFNLLTGSRQKVANFPGVTVEKKVGRIKGAEHDIQVIDLPGTYSIDAETPDELIAQQIILGLRADTEKPETVVVVVDSTHFERSLFLVSQLMEFGLKLIVCLNMYDLAKRKGVHFDLEKAEHILGVPVVPTIATDGQGKQELVNELKNLASIDRSARPFRLDEDIELVRDQIAKDLVKNQVSSQQQADFWAGKIMSGRWQQFADDLSHDFFEIVKKLQPLLEDRYTSLSIVKQDIKARHDWAEAVTKQVVSCGDEQVSVTDKIDRFALHPIVGPLLFLAVMTLVFQSVFSWASPLMDGVDWLFFQAAELATTWLPASLGRDMLVEGVIGGVGSVIIFMPQIMILFFFIGLLEASGYLSRAAYLVDRIMMRSGLTGKSFIPLLSSFACAIPGIMAARTIKGEKDRLITILVAPLMACSARLPVYTLVIAACIPAVHVMGIRLQAIVMLSLYLFGMLSAVVVAKIFRWTILRGRQQTLILELPDYKKPRFKDIFRYLWQRSKLFLWRAGKVILVMSVVLWFLTTFPRRHDLAGQLSVQGMSESEINSQLMQQSYAGQVGKFIEPVIAPLGFDWKVGVGLIASFAAREVFVATMGTLYNVQDADEGSVPLKNALRKDLKADGSPLFSLPMVVALLIFFVFAMQCLSTVAVIRRETNSWRWPIFSVIYTYTLAYVFAFLAYQGLSWWLAAPVAITPIAL